MDPQIFPPAREDRSTSFTLTVTLVLMAALVVLAMVLRREAAERTANDGPSAGKSNEILPAVAADDTPRIPVDKQTNHPITEYQAITHCRLEDDAGNDGDTFMVSTPQGTFRFSLYWVDAFDVGGSGAESAHEMMEHFGLRTEARLRELGVEAADFSLNMMRNRPFRLVTRWEKESGLIRAFVYLDDGTGGLQNLALMLVQNGLAVVRPCLRDLPEPKVTAGDFQNHLAAAEQEARQSRSGAWARKDG